jgi:hypothetical protein
MRLTELTQQLGGRVEYDENGSRDSVFLTQATS